MDALSFIPPGTTPHGRSPPDFDGSPDPARRAELRAAARAFEAAFLGEMLKAAGFGRARESFGGGPGEDAFSSLLVTAQAERMVEAGGIGVAEHVFRALLAREEGGDA